MHPSDDELVAACRAGKGSAFRELIERHQKRVYSLALRMTGNPSDAEDLAQETFVRAYSAMARYRPMEHGGFGAWLARITTNLCLNASRNGKRTVALDSADIDRLHVDSSLSDMGETLARSEAVHAAMQSLNEDYRAVAVLRFMDGLSYAEIAEVLGVPVSTVETRLHRAKKQLRELLKEWI